MSELENVRAACFRCTKAPRSEEGSKTGKISWCPKEGINFSHNWGGGAVCLGFFLFFFNIVLGFQKEHQVRAIQCYVGKCGFWLVVVVLLCLLQ